jgi:hypothetical protein
MGGLSLFASVVHELHIIRSRITPNETSTVRLDGASPASRLPWVDHILRSVAIMSIIPSVGSPFEALQLVFTHHQ